jgi:uncharacterized DUF497 family protein
MGKTVVSEDGCFEWDEEKDAANVKLHGFSFRQILEIFDDPCFVEGYDSEHSKIEDRYYGIGCLDNVMFVIAFYTERGARIRLISVRKADKQDEEKYYDHVKSLNS